MSHEAKTTAIIGAGALGVMYAGTIARADQSVVFVADHERASILRNTPVVLNDTNLRIPVEEWGERVYERIIVALKHHHMGSVVSHLPSIAGPDTTIISVMNGIDSERQLAEALGDPKDPRVLYAMAAGMDAVRHGRSVRFTRLGTIFFGEKHNRDGDPTPRVAALQQFFDRVGIAWKTPADMERALWNKFMLNVGINQWSAVLRASYGVFHTSSSAQDLMRRAMREVLEIARRKKIDLTDDDLEDWFAIVNTLSAEGKTSMLQDIDAGRKTEVEMFAGRVVELGTEVGVATPVNRILLDAIHTLEAMG